MKVESTRRRRSVLAQKLSHLKSLCMPNVRARPALDLWASVADQGVPERAAFP